MHSGLQRESIWSVAPARARRCEAVFCAKETSRKFGRTWETRCSRSTRRAPTRRRLSGPGRRTPGLLASPSSTPRTSVDPRDDPPAGEDAGLERRELGGAGAPDRGGGVAGEREERVAVAVL